MSSELSLFSQFDAFDKKVVRLVDEIKAARKRIDELETRIAERDKTIQEKESEIRELQKKAVNPPKGFSKSTNFAKIVVNNRNDAETTAELKQKLGAYIEELDRCIAYLSNLS